MNHWVTCPAGGLHFLFFISSIWNFFWLTLRWIYNIYQLSSELFLCYWPNNLASSINLKSWVETRPWSVLFWLFGFLETRSQYVVHAGLKLSPASVPLVLGSQVFCLGSLLYFPRVLCLDSLKHTPCSCSQWGNWPHRETAACSAPHCLGEAEPAWIVHLRLVTSLLTAVF